MSLKHESAIFYLYKVLGEFCLIKTEILVCLNI